MARAEALNEKDYSASTWKNLTTAKTAAQTVLDNSAATADDVSTALINLQSAMDKLAGRVTTTVFSKKLLDAEKRVAAAYTETSWTAFQTALTAAQATFKDDTATIPAVNQAYDTLYDTLLSDVAMDVSSEIAALQGMLANDGLTGRDFQ